MHFEPGSVDRGRIGSRSQEAPRCPRLDGNDLRGAQGIANLRRDCAPYDRNAQRGAGPPAGSRCREPMATDRAAAIGATPDEPVDCSLHSRSRRTPRRQLCGRVREGGHDAAADLRRDHRRSDVRFPGGCLAPVATIATRGDARRTRRFSGNAHCTGLTLRTSSQKCRDAKYAGRSPIHTTRIEAGLTGRPPRRGCTSTSLRPPRSTAPRLIDVCHAGS